MDSRLAETLEALSAYVQTQKSLFNRAEADIERLRTLKADALSQLKAIPSSLNTPGLRLSEQHEYFASPIPNQLHWQVFSSGDPTPLRTFAIRTRLAHTQRSVPHTTQHSPLSALQQFVKDSRRIIIDPVLESLDPDNTLYITSYHNPTASSFHASPDPPALSEDEDADRNQETAPPPVPGSFAGVRRHEHAHAKIHKLRERTIRLDGLAEHGEGAGAVSVRNDVDGKCGDADSCLGPSANEGASMDVDHFVDMAVLSTPPTPALPEPVQPLASGRRISTIRKRQPLVTRSESLIRSSRIRKPSLKLQSQSLDINMEAVESPPPVIRPSSALGKRSRHRDDVENSDRKTKVEPLPSVPDLNTDTGKARSGTYKQAWSVSEQHLLERLLEEIPEGERNRWAKISQAMGGSRTPRQVASRVQKYFEKLKRFGVGVEKKSKANNF